MQDHILIRYGELSLKKTNRNQFVSRIVRNIKLALKDFSSLKYENRGMRFYIILNGIDGEVLVPILTKIPGIYSFSIVSKCQSNFEDIFKTSKEQLEKELNGENKTFKVETNRGDKSFPYTSLEITKEVSKYLFRNIPNLKADVHNPDLTLNLDVRNEGTFIYTKVYKGLGGLPAGCLGRTMLMVSGGIDSVVAGYLSLKRGMTIDCIHFSSPPYTTDQAVQKVIDLLEKIVPYSEYQNICLLIVPFTKIQQAIYDNCRDDYGITIMRRMMYRITTKIAEKRKALAIINGENIGQVASQTLESMQTIGEVTTLPIIRPLATFDKSEIMDIAKKINTYDVSTRPYEDCCTVFVPKHPQIKPLATKAREEENKFNFEELIDEAVNNTEFKIIRTNQHIDLFKTDDDIF